MLGRGLTRNLHRPLEHESRLGLEALLDDLRLGSKADVKDQDVAASFQEELGECKIDAFGMLNSG